MENFKIIKENTIYLSTTQRINRCLLKCNKCNKEFTTEKITLYDIENSGNIVNTFYDAVYCPHCTNKLVVEN